MLLLAIGKRKRREKMNQKFSDSYIKAFVNSIQAGYLTVDQLDSDKAYDTFDWLLPLYNPGHISRQEILPRQ